MLYVSRATAVREADRAIRGAVADNYRIELRRERNGDRSIEAGFVAVLYRGGRFVGLLPTKTGDLPCVRQW